jgi:hypothetical protein
MKGKLLSSMGYNSDSQGIINRYIREEGGWEQHLQNTKKYIMQAAQDKTKSCVYVLGSGWLLDVPVDYLAKNFEKVFMVDVVHPKQIVHKFRKTNNIQFITEDITGGYINKIHAALRNAKSTQPGLKNMQTETFQFSKKPGFIVSVNLLSQLSNLLVEYMEQYNIWSPEELTNMSKDIQARHLALLQPGISCLVADYEEMLLDNKNNIHQKKQLIHAAFPPNKNQKSWEWKFDMSKTYHKNYRTMLNVKAMEI